MKIFSIKNLLGAAAIGGVVAYTRKHGGFKKTFESLLTKKNEALARPTSTTRSY
ncbi:MAG: MICOS complex subunit MIC60 [Myxococcota bacterium]|nr:hypothetical protein [Deltaproteobacteria bacterium]MDQ3337327.1 MICOS complex subunit MIC60 [Myxococcota bacterium]